MTTNKPSHLFTNDSLGSIVETTTILNQIMRPEGFNKDVITDLATSLFINNERTNIYNDTTLHLLAIKKMLLYAIPVIAPFEANKGIIITSQVNTPAIRLLSNNIKHTKIAIGDKFRLLGFTFPPRLINHLPFNVFPQKYYNQLPINYEAKPITIEEMDGLVIKQISNISIYVIDPKHYEDTSMFNKINKVLANKLLEHVSHLISTAVQHEQSKFPELASIEHMNKETYIEHLNAILEIQIDPTYSMSVFEVLQVTMNWMLYDNIALYGFNSPVVSERLRYLAYVKEQNLKVRQNIMMVDNKKLLLTRADKICREKYPYFFDHTDRRAIFLGFNRFSLNKLPKQERAEVEIILDKELKAQEALLNNKCEHLQFIKDIDKNLSIEQYKKIESYIDFQSLNSDGMYPCKLCKYSIICAHTVELYEALSSIHIEDDSEKVIDTDQLYAIRQKIINKYKNINQKRDGTEDTESVFTYYCKYCGSELGKSEDIIQASIKSRLEASETSIEDERNVLIYINVNSTITQHMNTSVITLNPKIIKSIIYNEIKDEILSKISLSRSKDEETEDTLLRYLVQVYTLVAIISIKVNKIKAKGSALVSKNIKTSDDVPLKTELLNVFTIIRNVSSYKHIGITDDKIKALVIEAFKFVNRSFAKEEVEIKSMSNSDKLKLDIISSPITQFAKSIYKIFEKHDIDLLDVSGVNLNVLFQKKRGVSDISTHALYTNLYMPAANPKDDKHRYILESYKALIPITKTEPIANKFISIVNEPISEFVKNYEDNIIKNIRLRRLTPVRILPAKNSREFNFRTNILQVVYCATTPVRAHRWKPSNEKGKVVYHCKYCNITFSEAIIKNNDLIEDNLTDLRYKESFYEMYSLSCPVKDAHEFDNGKCIKCGLTKDKIATLDDSYFKKYESTFDKYHKDITKTILTGFKKISTYSEPLDKSIIKIAAEPFDIVQLESTAINVERIFNQKDLAKLGIINDKPRSITIVKSFVDLFYSYYTFAKNVSIHVKSYSDIEFFKLVKKLMIDGVKKIHTLKDLPQKPESHNPDKLLSELLSIIFSTASASDKITVDLLSFIINKIITQNQRYYAFDFSKLKALTNKPIDESYDDMDIEDQEQINDEENDEDDIFNGYDIDAEDMEDNMNGEID